MIRRLIRRLKIGAGYSGYSGYGLKLTLLGCFRRLRRLHGHGVRLLPSGLPRLPPILCQLVLPTSTGRSSCSIGFHVIMGHVIMGHVSMGHVSMGSRGRANMPTFQDTQDTGI